MYIGSLKGGKKLKVGIFSVKRVRWQEATIFLDLMKTCILYFIFFFLFSIFAVFQIYFFIDNNNNDNLYFMRVTQSNTGFDFRCGPQI